MRSWYCIRWFLALLVVLLTLLLSCSNIVRPTVVIDETIQGKVMAIETIGQYTILYFGDGINIAVTTASIKPYIMNHAYNNVWTFNLHRIGNYYNQTLFDVVSISN